MNNKYDERVKELIKKGYNLGEVPDRTVNFYKIGDTNIQDFEYNSPAENVEIYG